MNYEEEFEEIIQAKNKLDNENYIDYLEKQLKIALKYQYKFKNLKI